MVKIIKSPYVPRPIQARLHSSLSRFSVLVCHRRFGKTVFAINHIIQKLLQNTLKRPQYAYIAPEKSQARKIAWDYLKEYTRFIPGVQFFEAELKVEIPLANDTKGVIYLEGAENPDRLRGMYFDGVILDEVAQMPRSIWTEIVRPAVSDRTGWALFIGTPKGKNYFKELFEYSKNPEMVKMGWSSFMYKASETGVLPADELASLRMEMTDEEYDQEYECNFDAAIPGSYYGKSLANLRKRNHIGNYNWNPRLPVITAWDIGMNDKTVIWFAQLDNNEVILIDYYENSDEILSHYINVIKSKPYVYDYHIMPHDVTQRSYTTGATRLSELEQMGLKCRVAKRTTVLDGINSARNMLLRCKFDQLKCSKGLDALAFYHSQYNDKNDVQQLVPVHDWSSHAADAFRYLATGMTGKSRAMSEYAQSDYDYFNTRQYSYKPHDPFEDS